MNLDISLILVPKIEQENEIKQIIDSLAKKYHSYSFIPHITVFHLGTTTILDDLIHFIDTELISTHPFDLELKNITYSDKFTKTLYANYSISPPLLNLYKQLSNEYNYLNDYRLAPHMSLIYKNNMSDEDKIKEIAEINLPKKLVFDRLFAITNENGSIKEERDILLWKTAHKISFK